MMNCRLMLRIWAGRSLHRYPIVQYVACLNQSSAHSMMSTYQKRSIHTTPRVYEDSGGFGISPRQKLLCKLRLENTTIPSDEIKHSAMRLFICCVEYNNLPLFRERFGLEDTLASWSHLVQLHTWMISLRLRGFSTPGLANDTELAIKSLNMWMWTDIEKRATKIASGKVKRQALRALQYQYMTNLLGYDEGYFTNDKVLAGAIWGGLLARRDSITPKQLTELLEYVHINLSHLQTIPDRQIIQEGFVNFIPLDFKKPYTPKDKAIRDLISGVDSK